MMYCTINRSAKDFAHLQLEMSWHWCLTETVLLHSLLLKTLRECGFNIPFIRLKKQPVNNCL